MHHAVLYKCTFYTRRNLACVQAVWSRNHVGIVHRRKGGERERMCMGSVVRMSGGGGMRRTLAGARAFQSCLLGWRRCDLVVPAGRKERVKFIAGCEDMRMKRGFRCFNLIF